MGPLLGPLRFDKISFWAFIWGSFEVANLQDSFPAGFSLR